MSKGELGWDYESKDGRWRKRVTKQGLKGPRPMERDECDISMSGEEKRLVIGEYETALDMLVERCLMTMCRQEECVMYCEHGIFEIKLKSFRVGVRIYSMTDNDKLELAMKHKAQGVKLFQSGEVDKALSRFRRCLLLAVFVGKDDQARSVYDTVCNNIALCLLKLGRDEHAVAVCDKVAAHEPDNVKCLLRRASALKALKDYEKAYLDLNAVLKIEPKNPQGLCEMEFIKEKLKDMNIRYSGMCKRMFTFQ
ncbi:peptidyl-prolyl cis-trans isomerase FKBP5-like [Cimex lectularius]|uniref:Uncharacterized protein n=1 Tax=Cimex lectularius TaxID=79782 RepID=A0A8I6RU18_CIMLE|nr:peptidyl-prolyl cis-trans isomerase FKBP5-like [Cimex lectularius]